MQKRFKGLGVWVAMLVVAYLIYMFAVGFGASQTKMVYSDLVNSRAHSPKSARAVILMYPVLLPLPKLVLLPMRLRNQIQQ